MLFFLLAVGCSGPAFAFLAVFHCVFRKLDLILLVMEFRASSRFPFLSMRYEQQILELARFFFVSFFLACRWSVSTESILVNIHSTSPQK